MTEKKTETLLLDETILLDERGELKPASTLAREIAQRISDAGLTKDKQTRRLIDYFVGVIEEVDLLTERATERGRAAGYHQGYAAGLDSMVRDLNDEASDAFLSEREEQAKVLRRVGQRLQKRLDFHEKNPLNVTPTPVHQVGEGKGVVVNAGEQYVFQADVSCRDGSVLPAGSALRVLRPTRTTPHREVGPQGHNWLCEAANGRTVWATLESCIERDLLRLASSESTGE